MPLLGFQRTDLRGMDYNWRVHHPQTSQLGKLDMRQNQWQRIGQEHRGHKQKGQSKARQCPERTECIFLDLEYP
jgi:hypothetical protein